MNVEEFRKLKRGNFIVSNKNGKMYKFLKKDHWSIKYQSLDLTKLCSYPLVLKKTKISGIVMNVIDEEFQIKEFIEAFRYPTWKESKKARKVEKLIKIK